ncbi:MAG: TolC family protein [Aureispira sp.]|nr:TolC family protein [Aureispira sp.]
MKNILIIISLLGLTQLAIAQQQITLDEIIDQTVQNNFDLKIAKNNIEASQNLATVGNAGFLPTVSLGAGYTFSLATTHSEFGGGFPDADAAAAISHNYNGAVNLDYTIFDGFKPKYTLQKSKVEVALVQTSYKQQVEDKIYQVIQAYYNLALLQADYAIAQEKLGLTEKQLKRVEQKRKFGQGMEAERLNLQTIYNNDSTQLMRLTIGIEKTIYQLNTLMGKEALDMTVEASPDIDLDLSLTYEAMLEKLKSNPILRQAQLGVNKADLDIKLAKTDNYPRLTTRVSYGITGQKNEVGIMLASTNFGPSVNVGLSYNIYNGGRVKTRIKNAQIARKNNQLAYNAAEYQLEQNLKDVYNNYKNDIALILLVERNLVIAQESFDRTAKAYELGQVTYLDYTQAQFNYIQTKHQVNDAKFNAKLSEWTVLKVVGGIVD